jgi:hypothetical protein
LISLLAAAGGIALCSRRGVGRGLLVAAALGVVFQFGHFGEHAAQTGFWLAHRGEAPWMTPWASALADSLAELAPGTPGFGMEALHLVDNTTSSSPPLRSPPSLAAVRRAPRR